MSLFGNILDVHTDWLTHKGYDQQGLGLTGTPQDLINSLEETFADVVKKNIWARRPVEFKLEITGQFGRGDNVQFNLHYSYDPNTICLNLLALRAHTKEQAQTWLITGNRQHLLPRSDQAYHQLHYQANIRKINRAISIIPQPDQLRPHLH